jgi:hypothetical protein
MHYREIQDRFMKHFKFHFTWNSGFSEPVASKGESSFKELGASILLDNGVVEFASHRLTPTAEDYAQTEKE